MRVGYVVLYVADPDSCLEFWTKLIGMQLCETTATPGGSIYQVGFPEQEFSFELVPLALMQDNPDGLDLATPSICFYVENLEDEHLRLTKTGVTVTEIMPRGSRNSFAFCDNEGRWFAVSEALAN